MNIKISFIKYIIAQNHDYYIFTGVIDDLVNKRKCIEINYTKNKFVIDILLMLIYAIITSYVTLLWFNIFYPVLDSYYNYLTYAPYNPNAGMNFTLLEALCLTILCIVWLLIIPIVIKLFRYLFGTRWFFTKFNIIVNKGSQKVYRDYFEFYNNNIAFQSGNLFYKESKKRKSLRLEYIKETYMANIIIKMFNSILLVTTLIIPITLYKEMDISLLFSTLLLAIILLFVSHIFGILLWKRYKRDK